MLQKIGVHQNIVRFLGCCTVQRPYFVIMEYVGRSDLVCFKYFTIPSISKHCFNCVCLYFIGQLSYLRTVRYENEKLKLTNPNSWGSQQSSERGETKLKYLELQISATESIASENESQTRVPKPSLAESKFA